MSALVFIGDIYDEPVVDIVAFGRLGGYSLPVYNTLGPLSRLEADRGVVERTLPSFGQLLGYSLGF